MTMAQTSTTTPVPTQPTAKGSPSPNMNMKEGLLNINKATHDQLAALGLNDATIDKIIQERPFHHKHDLLSDGILNEEEFSLIRDKVYAWSPMKNKPVK